MKRPKLNTYPVTDARSFINLDDNLSVDFVQYIKALNQYIDYLENFNIKCKHDFDCGIDYCELKKCSKFEMK